MGRLLRQQGRRLSRIRAASAAVALLLPIVVAGGCSADTIFIRTVAWLDDGWVYAIDDRIDGNDPLVRFNQDSAATPVLFAPAGCEAPSLDALARVGRNRLAVAATCAGQTGTGLFEYDATNGSAQQFGWIDQGVQDLAVAPDLRLGYLARSGSGLCWSLAQFRDGKVVGFTGPVTVDGVTWPIDHGYTDTPDDCAGAGDARSPAMADAGDAVYFAASGAAAGSTSSSVRFRAAASLVRMATPDGPVAVVADGFQGVLDVDVAPDGRSVAVTAKRDGGSSVWLVDPGSGRVSELPVPDAASVSFAPSDRQVVVVNAAGQATFHPVEPG